MEISTSHSKNFMKRKTDRYNAFASVIDSLSTVRWVRFEWSWSQRKCLPSSRIKRLLFHAHVLNLFIFLAASFSSYICYFFQTDSNSINISSAVSDFLILIGLIYASCYQINSLRFADEAEFHINSQDELNRRFATILSRSPTERWCSGILYYFCLMCNMSRPFFGTFMFPYFFKKESPMSLYYRFGGEQFQPLFFLYAMWSAYNCQMAYMITNYYAILCLGHSYFYTFWFKHLTKMMDAKPSEELRQRAWEIFQMLRIQNTSCNRAYSRMILPTVIICASAWASLSIVCLLRHLNDMDPLALFIILTAASQAIYFLSLEFYCSHRMAQDSEMFLQSFRRLAFSHPYWSRVVRSWPQLGISVGGLFVITISDLQVWAESLINHTILTLSII